MRFDSMKKLYARAGIALFALLLPRVAPWGFAWGPEGHHVTVILAEKYLTPDTAAPVKELLGSESLLDASVWADNYRHDHPETAPWHYIDIPLQETTIDLRRDCPNGDCVLAKTEAFLTVLKDPQADRTAKAEALKFVIHFVGDLHQPLHDEDDNDKGGNTRLVQLGSHVPPPGLNDNLHWLWDTGLIERINSNDQALAEIIRREISDADLAAWGKGGVEDWILEAHRLAQTVAYQGLGSAHPAVITPEYERQADQVIETQLARAGVRLAFLLNMALLRTPATMKAALTGAN
jgi:hypothetical protein